MSQSEESPITDTTPTGSASHLGIQSSDPDDLNHSAVETEHEESKLEHQLHNLDLKEEEEEEEKENAKDDEEETDKKDDGVRDSDGGTDGIAVGYEDGEDEEESNGYVKKNEVKKSHFPVRPEAEDCSYYMRTGLCKFGANCKFNHPLPRINQPVREKVKEKDESMEKPSQTECKYYLRTGGCKFGKACRYNHSTAKSSTPPILELNFLGLPIRQGERECPYYMRNGSCKYAASCRFNHPDPTAGGASDLPSGYGNGGSISSQAAPQVNMVPWSSPRPLNETAAYMPIMFSPSQVAPPPNPEWNGYQMTVYPPPERSLLPAPAYVMNNRASETTVYTHNQPLMGVDEFPIRPGQPECNYFVKNGDCKFKSNCKYHHPKIRVAKPAPCALSNKGLPLKPDQTTCLHYSRYGICKFGPACRFDHSKQEAPPTMSGLDQPPPFSYSAATEQTRFGAGTDTSVQQPV